MERGNGILISMDRYHLTSVLIVNVVEVLHPTSMGIITTTATIATTMEIITIDITMGDTENNKSVYKNHHNGHGNGISQQRETSVRLNVSSARKHGSMLMNAQKRRLMGLI